MSPIVEKTLQIGAMAIIVCDKVEEWEGKEEGMIEDIWRTVCWSRKRRL